MKSPWQKHSSTIVFENPWWRVRQDIITRPDGSPGQYNIVETSGSALVIALTDNDDIVFVEQFRYITGRLSLELPGGSLDDDKPLACAQRELQEESGITAHKWTDLGEFVSLNGVVDELTHAFLAQDLDLSDVKPEADEAVTRVIHIPVAEVYRRIQDNQIDDGQTLACLLKALLYLQRIK